ncbi:MAG: flagellar hook assembly protein FlgD [Betaproteobacteria bacterium]|jgi:flagellar basal-body rod modification protein FlgD|nr:flagellar hook assembly protein FlgD [Betaproteobacteria bacterium]
MTTTTTSQPALPNGIVRFEDYTAKKKLTPQSTEMGQNQFLTLFTTQLKNQNPLDPMKNEAFVAQLAQFSQLEATTAMKNSLDSMVSSMKSDRMLAGSSLIGRKVAVPDGPATLLSGQPVTGSVDLPTGADGVKFEVYNDKGQLVRSQILGAQTAGSMNLSWDGLDDNGQAMADGNYRFKVTASSNGVTSTPTVNTLSTVRSVSSAGTADDAWLLGVDGGKTISLSDVKRIGY